MLTGRAAVFLLGVTLGFSACDSDSSPRSSEENPDFGPLAVTDAQGGSDAAGGPGRVDIGDNCVTLDLGAGDSLLLVWHAHQVSWDEDTREITFQSDAAIDGGPVIIRDGDVITVGGESLGRDLPVRRDLTWLATPHPTCSGSPWAVDGVRRQ